MKKITILLVCRKQLVLFSHLQIVVGWSSGKRFWDLERLTPFSAFLKQFKIDIFLNHLFKHIYTSMLVSPNIQFLSLNYITGTSKEKTPFFSRFNCCGSQSSKALFGSWKNNSVSSLSLNSSTMRLLSYVFDETNKNWFQNFFLKRLFSFIRMCLSTSALIVKSKNFWKQLFEKKSCSGFV